MQPSSSSYGHKFIGWLFLSISLPKLKANCTYRGMLHVGLNELCLLQLPLFLLVATPGLLFSSLLLMLYSTILTLAWIQIRCDQLEKHFGSTTANKSVETLCSSWELWTHFTPHLFDITPSPLNNVDLLSARLTLFLYNIEKGDSGWLM